MIIVFLGIVNIIIFRTEFIPYAYNFAFCIFHSKSHIIMFPGCNCVSFSCLEINFLNVEFHNYIIYLH